MTARTKISVNDILESIEVKPKKEKPELSCQNCYISHICTVYQKQMTNNIIEALGFVPNEHGSYYQSKFANKCKFYVEAP